MTEPVTYELAIREFIHIGSGNVEKTKYLQVNEDPTFEGEIMLKIA